MSIVNNRELIESTLGHPNAYAVFRTQLGGTYAIRALDIPWTFNTLVLSPDGWVENEECLHNFLIWNGFFQHIACLVKCVDGYFGFTVGNYYAFHGIVYNQILGHQCANVTDDNGNHRSIFLESDSFDFGSI